MFNLFTRSPQPPNDYSTAMLRDLGDLQRKVLELESAIKLLRLEWDETFDKLTRAQKRHRMREVRDDAATAPTSPETAPDPISAAIWKRRHRGKVNGIPETRSLQG